MNEDSLTGEGSASRGTSAKLQDPLLRRIERIDTVLVARIFWVLAIASIVIWSVVPGYDKGWDVAVYKNAILSMRAGHDPYADAIAVQRAYQLNPHAYQPGVAIPFSYVYSPITLPLLRAIGLLPFAVSGAIYWTLFFVALGVTVWACMKLVQPEERGPFGLLATIALFFPGMIENDCFWSGNIAFILYAMIFAAAVLGWQRGRWGWFYAAVLAASCVKAPLLTLLAIPVLSARRQWLRAAAAGVAGVALFAMQPYVWPQLFRNYMEAVDLQFRFNRDFSSSPAGLIANALFFRAPYKTVSLVSYVSYGVPIVAALLLLSRRFFAGRITLQQFGPVLLLGTILLNPRIMEYDIAPITIPVALIVWRVCGHGRSRWHAAMGTAVVFAVVNILASRGHSGLSNPPWKLTAGCFLSAVFVAGVWELLAWSEEEPAPVEEPTTETAFAAAD